jgi:hypothetical protein
MRTLFLILLTFIALETSAQFMVRIDPVDPGYKRILQNADDNSYTVPSWRVIMLQSGYYRKKIRHDAWGSATSAYDCFYVFAHDGSQSFGQINWKNPGTFNLTQGGTVNFTSNVGIAGNGSNGYYTTNFNPTTAGGKMASGWAGTETYIVNNSGANARYDFGSLSGDNNFRQNMRNGSNTTQLQLQGSAVNVSNSASDGHWKNYRFGSVASPDTGNIRNGDIGTRIALGDGTDLINTEIVICRHGTNYGNRTIAMAGFGGARHGFITQDYNTWTYYFSNL